MKAFADILILFNSTPCGPARSGAGWQQISMEPAAGNVYSHVTDPDFGPKIFHHRKAGDWNFWMLGECIDYLGKGREQAFEALSVDIAADKGGMASANGHFVLFAFHSKSGNWHVWTDRFGTFHAYCASDGKRGALGTFFPSVAQSASAKALDWEGLAGYFSFGFFPQDRTFFKDVKILRPASHYVLNSEGKQVSQKRYWEWNYRPDSGRSYDKTVEEFGGTLEVILEDLASSGTLALPISSGLDSRTIAAILTKPGSSIGNGNARNLWAYSYGYTDDSHETVLAEKIAQARQLPFNRYTIPVYLWKRMPLILNSVEAFQGVVSTRQAAITDEIGNRADYILAAHWGDVWMDDMGLARLPGQKALADNEILEHALKKVRKKGGEWLLEHVCRPQLGNRNCEELLRDMVSQELGRVRQIEEADFRIKAFKTDQWSFRWTCASLRMFQPGAFPRLPFYDTRMADFCLTVPTEFVSGRRLQIDYLKRCHPDLARIPWDVTGDDLFAPRKDTFRRLVRRAGKKLLRILLNRPFIGRNWEIQFLDPRAKGELASHLLAPNREIHQWCAPGEIKELIQDVLSKPAAGNGYALSQLLSFSEILEAQKDREK